MDMNIPARPISISGGQKKKSMGHERTIIEDGKRGGVGILNCRSYHPFTVNHRVFPGNKGWLLQFIYLDPVVFVERNDVIR